MSNPTDLIAKKNNTNYNYSSKLYGSKLPKNTQSKNLPREKFVSNKSLVKKYGMWGDADGDNVPNFADCFPFDNTRHGVISNVVKKVKSIISKPKPAPAPSPSPTVRMSPSGPQSVSPTTSKVTTAKQLSSVSSGVGSVPTKSISTTKSSGGGSRGSGGSITTAQQLSDLSSGKSIVTQTGLPEGTAAQSRQPTTPPLTTMQLIRNPLMAIPQYRQQQQAFEKTKEFGTEKLLNLAEQRIEQKISEPIRQKYQSPADIATKEKEKQLRKQKSQLNFDIKNYEKSTKDFQNKYNNLIKENKETGQLEFVGTSAEYSKYQNDLNKLKEDYGSIKLQSDLFNVGVQELTKMEEFARKGTGKQIFKEYSKEFAVSAATFIPETALGIAKLTLRKPEKNIQEVRTGIANLPAAFETSPGAVVGSIAGTVVTGALISNVASLAYAKSSYKGTRLSKGEARQLFQEQALKGKVKGRYDEVKVKVPKYKNQVITENGVQIVKRVQSGYDYKVVRVPKDVKTYVSGTGYREAQTYNPKTNTITGRINQYIGDKKYTIKYQQDLGTGEVTRVFYKNGKYLGNVVEPVSESPIAFTELTTKLGKEQRTIRPGEEDFSLTLAQQKTSKLTADIISKEPGKYEVTGRLKAETGLGRVIEAGPAKAQEFVEFINPKGKLVKLQQVTRTPPKFTEKKIISQDTLTISQRAITPDGRTIGLLGTELKSPVVTTKTISLQRLGGTFSITPIKKPTIIQRLTSFLSSKKAQSSPLSTVQVSPEVGVTPLRVSSPTLGDYTYAPSISDIGKVSVLTGGLSITGAGLLKDYYKDIEKVGVSPLSTDVYKPSEETSFRISDITSTGQSSSPITSLSTTSITTQMQEQIQLPQEQISPGIIPPQIAGFDRPPKPIEPKYFWYKPPQKEVTTEKGYNTYVKEGGTYKKINKVALTLKSALSQVAERVDTSIAGEGKVRPINGRKVKVYDTGSRYYDQNSYKFRTYRVRKGTPTSAQPITLIEKRRYRLDSPGERGEIKSARILKGGKFRL
jgi:hypothetical protein